MPTCLYIIWSFRGLCVQVTFYREHDVFHYGNDVVSVLSTIGSENIVEKLS